MQELSLHILDIVTNAVEAEATRVIIYIKESQKNDSLVIRIRDNGRGMPKELVRRVSDPFVTTRTTRPVGMGISLAKQAAYEAKGEFDIQSEIGKGTELCFSFRLNCLNRVPLGDMADTLVNLVIGAPDVHVCYVHETDKNRFVFDSYWVLARMAEQECCIYDLISPAKQRIEDALEHMGSLG